MPLRLIFNILSTNLSKEREALEFQRDIAELQCDIAEAGLRMTRERLDFRKRCAAS